MIQCDNPACRACGAICALSLRGQAWQCLACGRLYEREDRMGNERQGGVEDLAKQIVGGFVTFAAGLVEAWRDLSPEEKMRLYLNLKDEAKKIARERR